MSPVEINDVHAVKHHCCLLVANPFISEVLRGHIGQNSESISLMSIFVLVFYLLCQGDDTC